MAPGSQEVGACGHPLCSSSRPYAAGTLIIPGITIPADASVPVLLPTSICSRTVNKMYELM